MGAAIPERHGRAAQAAGAASAYASWTGGAVVTGTTDIQLTYDLPNSMTHDEAVHVFWRHGLTNLLLGVGIQGKLGLR